MKNIKCHLCNGNLQDSDIKGSHFPWKDFSFVDLLVSFDALNCQKCGEVIIKGSDAKKLDEAIEESIRIQASRFLQTVKQNSKLSQKGLAKKMGITEVYFSEIISMKKTVSCQIFNYFKLLANHPNNLIDLDCFKGSRDCQYKVAQVSEVLDKFPYLEKEDFEQLKGERRFAGMLGDKISRVFH